MAKRQPQPRNWFAIWITAAVAVMIVAIVAIVVVANSIAASPGEPPSGDIINSETGAISFGDGKNTIAVYSDFNCPACANFEKTYGDQIAQLVEQGDVTLESHMISILDRASQGTRFSTRSASAMYCVAENDPDAALDFHTLMFKNQPDKGGSTLGDTGIINVARDAGAGDATAACIENGTYMKWVTATTQLTPTKDGKPISTPTVIINGEIVTITGDFEKDILANLK